MRYLAHIREDGVCQTVEEHCRNVAALAAGSAAPFGCAALAELAGLYHDIGKYSEEFQRRIRGDTLQVDHSTAGAQEARALGQLEAAFAIAGHHGGLPDGGGVHDGADSPSLFGRFQKGVPDYSPWREALAPLPVPPPPLEGKDDPFTLAFRIRMLYSCLVDADFLDTEAFMSDSVPRGGFEPLSSLLKKVREQAGHWLESKADGIGQIRNQILRACIDCGARSAPGLFTLTVPTGGGKTFSSLAFALEHAVKNGMSRVIYVVPYTSIIDQTVAVFQTILGKENVLGHYAASELLRKEEEDLTPGEYRHLLASENWDAPVIVTTAVQFFESLYANTPSKCRKLHNIAGSVLIFDEAQTLPAGYLRPCLAAIGELVRHFRASAVLCTATQPALEKGFAEFIPEYPPVEICQTGIDLYQVLKRTRLELIGPISQAGLGSRLASVGQVLCVVNRRKTAQALYESLPEEGRYCLTTLLTPGDRRRQLHDIRRRLAEGLPCRVVSTSLIEAGVDVDFPAAFREETGLDSILQTAGRCNREGRRPAEESVVTVFSLEESQVPPMLTQNRDIFLATARKYPGHLDSPEAIRSYFQDLWYVKGPDALDKKGILKGLATTMNGKMLPFRQVAECFRLIESPVRTVYLPVGPGAELCDRLRRGLPSRALFRRLGEHAVSVYPAHFEALYAAGALEVLEDGSAILHDLSYYSPQTGLKLDAESGQAFFI